MAQNLATVDYPGIVRYDSFSFCDLSGIEPATARMTVFPQYGLPDENGDIAISYNGQSILTLKNCHIDEAHYEIDGGGQIVGVTFLDERWTWKDASISGRYNFKLPNNWVDPNHEQTPQQLAILCFQALGVAVFDVSDLPNDTRPEVSWDSSNPAQELNKICGDLGCRITPIRSTGSWKICVTGAGADLPNYPCQDFGQGIDPAETPDYIKIVSGPVRYQVFLPLVAVGRDTDLSWRLLKQLTYAPDRTLFAAGFHKDPFDFGFMASVSYAPVQTGIGSFKGTERVPLSDGTKVSAQELARDFIFKSWRVDFANQSGAVQNPSSGSWQMRIPGITANGGYATVEQIILSDELVQSYTDTLGTQHQRPSFVQGQFFGRMTDGSTPNYPAGTRIDKQAARSDTSMDERSSFSLSLDPIDTKRSIISTSGPMLFYSNSAPVEVWTPAILQYCCAIHVRDPVTWQPARYEYLYQIGSGTNQNFCRVEIKDDIQPWIIGNYPTGSTAFTSFTSNIAEVQQQSLYYAQSIAREYQLVNSQTKTFIGIYSIDMDGAIQQVSYEIGKGGHSTKASRGTEHNIYTPSYEDRRQMSARQGIAGKVEYARNETARRQALIGSFNT